MKLNATTKIKKHNNKNITMEINSHFIAAGCFPMMVRTDEMDYYHSKTGIYIRYSPKLLDGPYSAQRNLTEIVIVTNNETTAPTSTGDIPCEVIKLIDLAEFLKFRESGSDCIKHRAARQRYEQSLDDILDADDAVRNSTRALHRAIAKIEASKAKVEAAKDVLTKVVDTNSDALATYFATKPPRFIAKHAAYATTLSRVDMV